MHCVVGGAHAFILRISSFFGLAPLRFESRSNGFSVGISSAMCVYSYILVTVLVISTIFGLVAEINVGVDLSVRMTSRMSQFVSTCDVLVVVITAGAGVYGAPKRMRNMLKFMESVASVDTSIGAHYSLATERKLCGILIAILLFFSVLITDDFFFYALQAKKKNRQWDVVTNYIGFYLLWYVVMILELQFAFTALSVRARFQAVNGALALTARHIAVPLEKVRDPTPLNIFAIRVAAESRRCANNVSLLVDTMPGREHAVIIRNAVSGEPKLVVPPCEAIRRLACLHGSLCSVVQRIGNSYGLPLIVILISTLLHLIVTPYFLIMEIIMMVKNHMSTVVALVLLFGMVYGQTETEPPSTLTTRPATTTAAPTTVAWETETLNEGQAIQKALQYLLQNRQPDWGWGNDTHHVMLTLQLANNTGKEIEQQGLEMQLSAKQMDIEILLMMSKHHESPPPLGRLAAYTLALGALCKDPRSFHGRDLVATLLHREPPHDLEFAYATLAACSSAAHVRRRHIRRLLDIANAAADHSLDAISMVILALRCVVQDHRHRSLIHFVRRPMAGLARQQHPDGSFGTLTTTALAIQALEDSDNGPGAHQHWSLPAARKWLLERQEPDGGWGDVAKTAAAVAALTPASLAAVRPPHCSDKLLDSRHEPLDSNGGDGSLKMAYQTGHSSNDSDARNVSFTYTLWLGTNVTENYTLYMVAPRNISFYHVMQMAAEQEPKFKFEASEWPNGHYVHTLAGHKEEPMGYHYWLLYRLPEIPDPTSPPGNQLVAPVGVDDLLVEDGEHYLFWYKKL